MELLTNVQATIREGTPVFSWSSADPTPSSPYKVGTQPLTLATSSLQRSSGWLLSIHIFERLRGSSASGNLGRLYSVRS